MGVYGFCKRDAARIRQTVQRVERGYQNETPRRRGARPADSGLIPALVTSSLTAGSFASPTAFTFTLLKPASPTGPALTTDTAGLTGYNPYSKAVTVSTPKSAWMRVYNGSYYLVTLDC